MSVIPRESHLYWVNGIIHIQLKVPSFAQNVNGTFNVIKVFKRTLQAAGELSQLCKEPLHLLQICGLKCLSILVYPETCLHHQGLLQLVCEDRLKQR